MKQMMTLDEMRQKLLELHNGYEDGILLDAVPSGLHEGLLRWMLYGIPPGDFLTAFLKNDLMGAMGRADDLNRHRFFDICVFLYNVAPGGSYGSVERFTAWRNKGGILGYTEDGA